MYLPTINFHPHIKALTEAVLDFIYPQFCIGCNENRPVNKQEFCISCLSQISFTDHFEVEENELLFRVAGRLELQWGAALFNFIKGGRIQQALHRLKYENKPEVGLHFGEQFGKKMLEAGCILPDYLIPIPLHYTKQQIRGYNQSERFARGISNVLNIPINQKVLLKHKEIISQTKKNREDRFPNVLDSFSLKNSEQLRGKTIMIVDDVMTTGATVEAAYTLLSDLPDVIIQVGIIALADG